MARKPKSIEDDIAKAAITIVDRERVNWEEAVSFITPKVGFRMRELIRICRKNYWGVFDDPYDKQTQREKVWIGLAMSTVETWLKNIDLDTKDIGFLARSENGYEITELTRLVVKDYLDRMYFGETIDADERSCLIDGTVVWKSWEDNSTGKPVLKRRTVDLLNFYIDPTEENIQTAYRVTERAILLPSQIEGMTGWKNTDDLPGSQILNRIDGNRRSNFGTRMTGEYRDVWETWGKIPKWMITGDKEAEDAREEVDGHIVISGLEAPKPTMHLVEANKKKDKFGVVLKPYEEWRAAKISNRWYGLGVIERLLALQEYLNTVVNIRINRGYVSQLGLFKIKKGKGITAQMLNRLPVNGAIQVTDMDDVQQMTVAEAGETSYKDEEVIKYWAQAVTSAYPISTGEILPSSASATATAVANASSKSAYTMFKEGTGGFFERWIDRAALPVIAKTVKQGDIIRLGADDDKFKDLITTIALFNVSEAMEKSNVIPSQQELMTVLAQEEEKLSKKPQMFIEILQELLADEVDTRVHITNEDLDSSVTVQNLIQLAQIAPQDAPDIVKQIYDLMGLERPAFKAPAPQGPPQGQQAPVGARAMPPNLTGMTQVANSPLPNGQ